MAFCGSNLNNDFDEKKTAAKEVFPPVDKILICTVGGRMSADGTRLEQLVFDYKTQSGKQLSVHGKAKGTILKSVTLLPWERIIEAVSFRQKDCDSPLGVGAEFRTSRDRTLLIAGEGIKNKFVVSEKFSGWMMTGVQRAKTVNKFGHTTLHFGFEALFMDKPSKAFKKRMASLEKKHGGTPVKVKTVPQDPKDGLPMSKIGYINFGERRKSALYQFRGTCSPWFARKLDGKVMRRASDAESLPSPHGSKQFQPPSIVYEDADTITRAYPKSPEKPMSPQPQQTTNGQRQATEEKEVGPKKNWFGSYKQSYNPKEARSDLYD